MQLTGDYHTHTIYSEGKGSVLGNANAAKEKGIMNLGITDHGFNHIFFGLRRRKVPYEKADIEEAKDITGVNVLMGMESNLIGVDGTTDMKVSDYVNMDIYLFGIHIMPLFKSPRDRYYIMWKNFWASRKGVPPKEKFVETTTKAYINCVKKNPVDILTHINYKCFCDVVEVAKACSDYGTYLEINTKKEHITPEQLSEIEAKTSVRFVIDSDAHWPERVGDTKIAEDMIEKSGISLDRIDNIEGRTPTFRFAEYKSRNL
ncbi:MAG: PHP domain-containing protein [Clostridia bacterium]|nr:PHP domain-containing protein [Clostridia bacterium]